MTFRSFKTDRCSALAVVIQVVQNDQFHPHGGDSEQYEQLCQSRGSFDDISGHWVDKGRAILARMPEINVFKEMRVYTEKPIGAR